MLIFFLVQMPGYRPKASVVRKCLVPLLKILMSFRCIAFVKLHTWPVFDSIAKDSPRFYHGGRNTEYGLVRICTTCCWCMYAGTYFPLWPSLECHLHITLSLQENLSLKFLDSCFEAGNIL